MQTVGYSRTLVPLDASATAATVLARAQDGGAMLTRALELAALGWHLLPLHGVVYDHHGHPWCTCRNAQRCKSPAKHPRTPNGLKNASVDQKSITAWWRKWPNANIGIVTGVQSGLVVLDVDPSHGGEDSLDEWQAHAGKLPATAEVITGGGGRHLYFKHPGIEIRNSTGKLGPGLDIRGDGGYVVGPGSMHISGRTYDWEASSSPEQVCTAPMPRWMIEACTGKRAQALPPTEALVVAEGRRNAWLTRLAGWLRRNGVGETAIAQALAAVNAQHCDPPLEEDEVRAIAHSVTRYASQAAPDQVGSPPRRSRS